MDAKNYAVKLLSFRDRSEKELRDALLKKGYGEEEIEGALIFCAEYGYINDAKFAEKYLHDAIELKRQGFKKTRMELTRKGVDKEIIESLDAGDEEELLKSEIARRFKDADFSDKKVKNRALGYFLRRGFSLGDILRAMGESEYE